MLIINIADLTNLETGKTYREENLAMMHKFPVGALVEIVSMFHPEQSYSQELDERAGIRLRVIKQTRDCDGTPLYSLGIINGEVEKGDLMIAKWDFRLNRLHVLEVFHGFGEEQLVLIQSPIP